MVNVSKRELSKSVRDNIKKHVVDIFFVQNTRKDFEKVIYELLTSAEYMVLAKRISAIALLNTEHPPYRVAELLCMSPTTVGKIQDDIEKGVYTHVQNALKRKRGRRIAVEILETLVVPGAASKKLREQMRTTLDRWTAGA